MENPMQDAIESEHPIQKTIDMAYEQFEAIAKRIKETGYDQQYAQMMMNASDPDEEFLTRKMLEMTSLYDQIGTLVRYLHKPVKVNGIISYVTGKCFINGVEIPIRSTIEFMHEDKWQIGKLEMNKETEKPYIVSDDMKIRVDDIFKIKVRMR